LKNDGGQLANRGSKAITSRYLAGFTPGETGFHNCSSESLSFTKLGSIGVKPMGSVRDDRLLSRAFPSWD
jgi:hypothetical protein